MQVTSLNFYQYNYASMNGAITSAKVQKVSQLNNRAAQLEVLKAASLLLFVQLLICGSSAMLHELTMLTLRYEYH